MVQLLVGKDKASNLQRAVKLVREVASKGAQVIALPVSNWRADHNYSPSLTVLLILSGVFQLPIWYKLLPRVC